jgi:hypothetical protein
LGEVHRLVNEMMEPAVKLLRKESQEGALDQAVGTRALQLLLQEWEGFIKQFTELIARGMWTGASLPFGMLAVYHAEWVLPHATAELDESLGVARLFQEQINDDIVFKPQLQAIVEAATRRTYGDGLNLSQRIWQLDTWGRNGLNQAVTLAMGRGASAWQLAQDVEQFLGSGQDCPRWTRDRLYSLTKADIASGDRTGLHSGDECRGQGVSYNALRLARTEIQAILNMATDHLFAQMPWIEMEQINLSPDHAVIDICDDAINDSETGDGVYPKGTIALPFHPHCLCYKTAVLMEPDQFVGQLRDWLGGGSWPAMDTYASMIGGNVAEDLRESGVAVSMAYWLWGDAVDLGTLFWTMALN